MTGFPSLQLRDREQVIYGSQACMTLNKSFMILKPQFSHGDWDEGAVKSKQTNALNVLSLLPGAWAPR